MTDKKWPIIENIAILAAVCFLVWATGSGWWALLMLGMNYWSSK
jgi:hypothetical protein